jgi:TP901 family phage tail tape measure protein
MALSAHELVLILRARDEASRVVRGFAGQLRSLDRETAAAASRQMGRGAALSTLGVALAATGVVGLSVLNNMTNAAIDFNEQTARTATQVDKAGVSFNQLKKMARDLASDMPVQFEQVQGALYDIFSSIDTNGPGAMKLLRGIGLAAVAGSVDMETAGRALIGVLNAYKLPATQVNRINDVMFQLVRKGVGTYQAFASTIGRAVPSAIKAGQSVESLAGMLAFLTRNGLSTAMASASAARALDALSNPATIKHFKQLGIEVADSTGHFRPVVDVMEDLRKKLIKLTPVARAAALKELFKNSGGTIQAMRFFNHAVADSSGLLREMTENMKHAGGASAAAYKTMANTPQARIQLLKNQFQVLRTEIGDQLIPAKMRLMEVLSKLLNWFNNLSPSVQRLIIKVASFAAVGAVVLGVLVAVVGLFLTMAGAAALAGTSLTAIAVTIVAVGLGLAQLALLTYVVIKHWQEIKATGLRVWAAIWGYVGTAMHRIETATLNAVAQVRRHWAAFLASFAGAREAFGHIVNAIIDVWNYFAKAPIWPALRALWESIFPVLVSIVTGAIQAIGNILSRFLDVLGAFIRIVIALINGDWGKAWQAAKDLVKAAFDLIWAIISGAWTLIIGIVKALVVGIISFFKKLYDDLVGHSIVPDLVRAIINWFAKLPVAIVRIVINLVTSVVKWFLSLPSKVVSALSRLGSNVRSVATNAMNMMISAVRSGVASVVSWAGSLPSRVVTAIGNLGSLLYEKGIALMRGAYDGVITGARIVIGWLGGLGTRMMQAIGNLSGMLIGVGEDMIRGLIQGIENMAGAAVDAAKGAVGGAVNAAKRLLHIGSPSKVFKQFGRWVSQGFAQGITSGKHLAVSAVTGVMHSSRNAAVMQLPGVANGNNRQAAPSQFGPVDSNRPVQNFTINTQEIDPRKHAAELGWEMAVKVG